MKFDLDYTASSLPKVVTTYEGIVHNFSSGCLRCYFYLDTVLGRSQAHLFHDDTLLSLVVRGRRKTYVYNVENIDQDRVSFFQQTGPVFSLQSLPWLPKERKFIEIAYDLDVVFSPTSYPNAKKRHQRITYPITWLQKNNIQISPLLPKHMQDVKKLHDAWVQNRLKQPTTYKIMFPTGRYMHCCKLALENQYNDLRGFVFTQNEIILAVRIIAIQYNNAFDLAFFGNIWDTPSQLTNYCDILSLKLLQNEKIHFFNCGNELNKRLRVFKQHLPSFNVISYIYAKNEQGE